MIWKRKPAKAAHFRDGLILNLFFSYKDFRNIFSSFTLSVPAVMYMRRARSSLLGRRGGSLCRLLLVVLAHDGVTRLVAVVLITKLLLLFDLVRIAIPRVLPLVRR